MNIRLFKNTRQLHKWIGLVGAIFFLILSVTGVILMHYESWGLNDVQVSGKYIPQKYFQVATNRAAIQALAVMENPSPLIFAGTERGLYRSGDGGKTWTESKEGLFSQDIRSLAVAPGQENVIYAGTSRGVFKSEEGGAHWTDWFEAASGLDNTEVNGLAIHPRDPERIYAATQGGLYRSEDGGESWELSFAGGVYAESKQVKLVRISAARPETLYISTGKGNYRSIDGGGKWEKVWESSVPEILSLVSLNTDPEFLYAGTGKGLYKSFNKGRTWVKDRQKGFTRIQSLFVNLRNISHVYLASGSDLYQSRDGGDSWENMGFVRRARSRAESSRELRITSILETAGTSPLLLVGTTGGLFLSRDSGRHWTVQDVSGSANRIPPEDMKMDLVKLITEIHTGRFFGSYFYLLVDLATLGLVLLVVSGILVSIYRAQLRWRRKARIPDELETDMLINIQETADDLSSESLEIHNMIEHINNHLEKCKMIYMTREKKEIEEIGRHITTLDKKMHHLMERIGEFEKYSQN
ncbi:MAG: PepSY domain-containing protein [Nitrospinaceae bacterium]